MKRFKIIFIFFIFTLSIFGKDDEFIKLVKPIIISSELKIYKSLKTEEEKKKFREQFWKARDPVKSTPVNEFYVEYIKRVDYAKKHLRGINSPRGRIYIFLGKPLEVKKYLGYEKLVDSELWIYKIDKKKYDLPSFIYLLFFRPGNMGDYELYYPGINTPLDLLTPSYSDKIKNRYEAYRQLRMDFPELAQASLSVIPMEKSPIQGYANSSSNRVITQIQSIPEKIVDKSYLKGFSLRAGLVDIEDETVKINARLFVNKGIRGGIEFIYYSFLPDRVKFFKIKDNEYKSILDLTERLEDGEGNLVYEKTEKIILVVNEETKKKINSNGFGVSGFIPVIKGGFILKITLLNKRSNEVSFKEVEVSDNIPFIGIGKGVKEETKGMSPFSYDDYKIVQNPKGIYGKKETIFFAVYNRCDDFKVLSIKDKGLIINPELNFESENFNFYSLNLEKLEDGGYEVYVCGSRLKTKMAIIPFSESDNIVLVEKKNEVFNENYYNFILGEEYLNIGMADLAYGMFQKVGKNFWTEKSIVYYGKALYLLERYEEVISLLKNFKFSYEILALLSNSYLKLNNLEKAAIYFEELRKYGDSVEINNKLGAIYFSLGDKKRAKVYWDRAKRLKEKKAEMEVNNDKK